MVRTLAAIVLVAASCGWIGSELATKPDDTTVHISPPVVAPLAPTADTPTTALLGPDKPVKYGKIVSVTIKPLEQLPENLQSVIYAWQITPPVDDLVVWSDNTKIFFGSGVEDATYKVEVVASYLFGKRTGDTWTDVANQVARAERTIVISNTGPTPVIPPTPPILPDGKYKLAQSALDWLPQVILDAPIKKADTAALAADFSATAKKISASISATNPEIHNADEALAAIKIANVAAVGARRAAWLPWFTSLDNQLKSLRLGTTKGSELQELADGFTEIATGLTAAQ